MLGEDGNDVSTGLIRKFWIEVAPHGLPFLTSLLGNTLSEEPSANVSLYSNSELGFRDHYTLPSIVSKVHVLRLVMV